MFIVIEVKEETFTHEGLVGARFSERSDCPNLQNGNGNLALVVEIKSGETVFLTEELQGKSFFFFPFKKDGEEEFRDCLFWEIEFYEDEDDYEGGYEEICANIKSKPIMTARLGIVVKKGVVRKMELIEGRELRSLL